VKYYSVTSKRKKVVKTNFYLSKSTEVLIFKSTSIKSKNGNALFYYCCIVVCTVPCASESWPNLHPHFFFLMQTGKIMYKC